MDKFKIAIEELGANRVKLNEAMARHTTFKIGGQAKLYYEAGTINDLVSAVKIAREKDVPYFILGGGSNLLVSDKGFDGLIIKNNTNKIQILALSGKVNKGTVKLGNIFVEAESGVPFNRLIRFTLNEDLSGLEYFLGQPGTVGGAVWINAHFQRKNIFVGDFVVSAKILTPENSIEEVDRSYFRFSYDESRIKKTKDIVLSVTFKLKKGDKKMLWERGMESLEFRKNTQPSLPSAGCIFRNINKSDAIRLGTPEYTCSAGYLIDQCGLKGQKEGDVMISEQHANFIVNCGNGKATDVKKLIEEAQIAVANKFNVKLVPEIVFLGDF